jgi:hypothetical protein
MPSQAAKAMINDAVQAINDPGAAITLGADKGYDAKEFIEALTDMKVIPYMAQNTSGRHSAVPDEIANTEGYKVSQQKRKRFEQGFGWVKTSGNMRLVMVRGLEKFDQMFVLTMAAYNLTRMRFLRQLHPEAAQQGRNDEKQPDKVPNQPAMPSMERLLVLH